MTDPLGFFATDRCLIGWAAVPLAFAGLRILTKIGPPELAREVERAEGISDLQQSIRHWGFQGAERASRNLAVDSLLLVPSYVVMLSILSVHFANGYASGSTMRSAGFVVAWIVCCGGISDWIENGLVFALVQSVGIALLKNHEGLFRTTQIVAKCATLAKFAALGVTTLYLVISLFAVSWV